MMHPTIDQLCRLRRAQNTLRERLKVRDNLANLLRAYDARHKVSCDQLNDRTDFRRNPNLFVGMCAVYQRQLPQIQKCIDIAYEFYLIDIKEAVPPATTPHVVDFHALSSDARPYLLGAFLNLTVGRFYPRLCLKRSAPEHGQLTYIATGGPIAKEMWRERLPDIAAWLGDAWVISGSTASTISLRRQQPLPKVIQFDPSMSVSGALSLGIDVESHQPIHLPFADMTSGTFIPGASGTGKSNALHILLQSIFTNLEQFAAVFLVDGKDGVAFNRYRNIAPGKVHVLWDEPDVWKLTNDLVGVMRARNTAQREAGIDKTTRHLIAVVIDEMSTYTTRPSSDTKHPDNKRHAQFIDDLAILAKRGRSTGLRLIITAQEPVNADIPANVRANCLTTISFKLPIDAHAIAVFNQLEGLPADPRKLSQGQALIKHGLTGQLQTVQFPLIPPPEPRRRS